MNDAELDAYIHSAAALLGLTIRPAWHEPIRTNLAISLRMAAVVEEFALPDEADPAPVFTA
jgi:1-carboxybiuret hydrolase subunit AtzG-like